MKGSFKDIDWTLPEGKKVYFASDFHFGIPNAAGSLAREKRVVAWLDRISTDAYAVFLQGDLFDAWIEYEKVVPRGFVRFLGKLAEMSDRGIRIVIFTGNHDLWMTDYLQKEIGAEVHHNLQAYVMNGKRFLLGHGDGVSEKEGRYKAMKAVFKNPLGQRIYRFLHPSLGLGLAQFFSSRGLKHREAGEALKPDADEFQWQFAEQVLAKEHFDFILFGHRHIAQYRNIGQGVIFINLGDWFKRDIHAVFDGDMIRLINY